MKCQGRPEDGVCPDNCNDNSVHNTIGDLMLCHACEEYRWPTVKASKVTDTVPTANNAKQGKSSAKTRKAPLTAATSTKATGTRTVTSRHSDTGGPNSNPNGTPVVGKLNDVNESDGEASSCFTCHSDIDSATNSIACDICHNVFHQQCSGLPTDMFESLKSIILHSGWVCRQCRHNYSGLQVALNKATEELSDMRTSIAWLFEEVNRLKVVQMPAITAPSKSEHLNLPANSSETEQQSTAPLMDLSAVRLEVHRTVLDATKRKCNVIVTGLPEATGEDAKTEDHAAFVRFCEENLSVKPVVSHKGCVRLGKHTNAKPRRLLVHLTSESSATSLLNASKNLKRTDQTKGFYVNPDLSPLQAQLAFEQRQRRRATSRPVGSSSSLSADSAEFHPASISYNDSYPPISAYVNTSTDKTTTSTTTVTEQSPAIYSFQ
jgi:PHD-finger